MRSGVALIRLDKIGDLILTLPVDEAVPKDQQAHWVISQGLLPILNFSDPVRRGLEIPLLPAMLGFKTLLKHLRQIRPQASVIFYAPWWAYLACFLAGIPLRGGRLSQWASYLFLNRGLRQSRSQSEKHEYEYNLDLVQKTFSTTLPNSARTNYLKLKSPKELDLLKKWELEPQGYIVIHPGMAGSALNWPMSHYSDLIENSIEKTTVVVTGTSGDQKFLKDIADKWQNHPQVRWTVGQLNMPQLLSLLAQAKSAIAPSTGVLHLSASLGTKSVGIYSPLTPHHPRRWSARGKQVQIFLPNVSCPANGSPCLKENCKEHPCMQKISVADVAKSLDL